MEEGKILTLEILLKYRTHCQTTVDMGDDADLENLEDVKKAMVWVELK